MTSFPTNSIYGMIPNRVKGQFQPEHWQQYRTPSERPMVGMGALDENIGGVSPMIGQVSAPIGQVSAQNVPRGTSRRDIANAFMAERRLKAGLAKRPESEHLGFYKMFNANRVKAGRSQVELPQFGRLGGQGDQPMSRIGRPGEELDVLDPTKVDMTTFATQADPSDLDRLTKLAMDSGDRATTSKLAEIDQAIGSLGDTFNDDQQKSAMDTLKQERANTLWRFAQGSGFGAVRAGSNDLFRQIGPNRPVPAEQVFGQDFKGDYVYFDQQGGLQHIQSPRRGSQPGEELMQQYQGMGITPGIPTMIDPSNEAAPPWLRGQMVQVNPRTGMMEILEQPEGPDTLESDEATGTVFTRSSRGRIGNIRANPKVQQEAVNQRAEQSATERAASKDESTATRTALQEDRQAEARAAAKRKSIASSLADVQWVDSALRRAGIPVDDELDVMAVGQQNIDRLTRMAAEDHDRIQGQVMDTLDGAQGTDPLRDVQKATGKLRSPHPIEFNGSGYDVRIGGSTLPGIVVRGFVIPMAVTPAEQALVPTGEWYHNGQGAVVKE